MIEKQQDLRVLENIRLKIAEIREANSNSASDYILHKLDYETLTAEFISKDNETKTIKEKEQKAKDQFKDRYIKYKSDKAQLEHLDREFRNLDAQRRILETKIANY